MATEPDRRDPLLTPITEPDPRNDRRQVTSEVDGIRSRLQFGKNGEALLDEVLIEEMSRLVAEGMRIETACKVCGVRRPTMTAWAQRGQADVEAGAPTLHARLAWAIDRAQGEQEIFVDRGILSGVRVDHRHALQTGERMRPGAWAPALPEREDPRQRYGKMGESEMRTEMERLLALGRKNEAVAPALPPAPSAPLEDD